MNSYVLNKHQNAEVAQSVEQGTENPRVSGSIPFLGICSISGAQRPLHQQSCRSLPLSLTEVRSPCRFAPWYNLGLSAPSSSKSCRSLLLSLTEVRFHVASLHGYNLGLSAPSSSKSCRSLPFSPAVGAGGFAQTLGLSAPLHLSSLGGG